jgi:tRNA G18 (ribose-2'-O)-methylase SpoU
MGEDNTSARLTSARAPRANQPLRPAAGIAPACRRRTRTPQHTVLIRIASADDPRIAPYRVLKDRDLDRGAGRFIVEGTIALERLIHDARFPVDSLFLSDKRTEKLAPLIARLDPATPVFVVAQAVMDALAGYHLHRGVLALARRSIVKTAADLLHELPPAPLTVLVLIGLSNHDNVGGCFRNAAALGASAVLLDETSCDPLYRKSIRVSSGAALSLPFAHSGDGASILAALDDAGFESWSLSPTGGDTLQALAPPERLALVLGAEGPGLPDTLMSRSRRVSIPMAGNMDSLNVATAGAIALSHVLARRPTSRA